MWALSVMGNSVMDKFSPIYRPSIYIYHADESGSSGYFNLTPPQNAEICVPVCTLSIFWSLLLLFQVVCLRPVQMGGNQWEPVAHILGTSLLVVQKAQNVLQLVLSRMSHSAALIPRHPSTLQHLVCLQIQALTFPTLLTTSRLPCLFYTNHFAAEPFPGKSLY